MSEKILIIGKNSKIAQELKKIIPKDYLIFTPSKKEWNMKNIVFDKKKKNIIETSNKIILLNSIISSKNFLRRTEFDILDQIKINLISILRICEIALNKNPKVRIAIMGSKSGIKGSYDIIYALTKASLHKYVEERKIKYPEQQIFCISPSTIIDAGITTRRNDQNNVKKSIEANPKKRGINCKEISNLLYSFLFEQTDYISNTVIRVDGGKFSRM